MINIEETTHCNIKNCNIKECICLFCTLSMLEDDNIIPIKKRIEISINNLSKQIYPYFSEICSHIFLYNEIINIKEDIIEICGNKNMSIFSECFNDFFINVINYHKELNTDLCNCIYEIHKINDLNMMIRYIDNQFYKKILL